MSIALLQKPLRDRLIDAILATPDLRALLVFDLRSGTAVRDLARPTVTGTMTSGTPVGKGGAWALDGLSGIQLNGSSQHVSLADAAALDLGNVGSYEMLFRFNTASPATCALISKGTNCMQLGYDGTNDRLRMNVDSMGADLVYSSVTILDTNMHHVIIGKNGSTRLLVQDGVNTGINGTDRTASSNATAMSFGSNQGASEWSNITMFFAAVYARLLTLGEAREHASLARGC